MTNWKDFVLRINHKLNIPSQSRFNLKQILQENFQILKKGKKVSIIAIWGQKNHSG